MTTQTKKNSIVHKSNIDKQYSLLQKKYHQKSPIIRALSSQGYTRSQIAKVMNIRYQHVRNVLVTKLVNE